MAEKGGGGGCQVIISSRRGAVVVLNINILDQMPINMLRLFPMSLKIIL